MSVHISVLPIQRHHASSETVVILSGKIEWVLYDDNGNETERVVLDANGEPRMLNVVMGQMAFAGFSGT